MSTVNDLINRGLITPPNFIKSNIHYEVMMGSVAYGCSNDTSDIDLYGFCIPPKEMIFPHLSGYIQGFGKKPQNFEQYQQHHINDETYKKEYDISMFGIVKYFQLAMDNVPNMIDSLFVPRRCILHSTKLGEHVRENRKLFLSKKAWHSFKGYSYSQLQKCKNKNILKFVQLCDTINVDYYITMEEFNEKFEDANPSDIALFKALFSKVHQSGNITKRINTIVKYGYDVKFAYHIVRLLNEVEQILTEEDIDLERNREQLKSIRRGDWTIEEIEHYFQTKELELENLHTRSTLKYSADEEVIKKILLECLEMHYGSLDKCVLFQDRPIIALRDIQAIIEKALR